MMVNDDEDVHYQTTFRATEPLRSQSIGALAAALSKAQAAFKTAPKDSVNPHFKSRYADLASITEASREALAANNLAVIQLPIGRSPEIGLRTLLAHSSGEYIGADFYVTSEKNTPQGAGSCITYLRRYGRSAVLGIAQDDDDGNESSAPSGYNPQNRDHQDKLMAHLKAKGVPEQHWDAIGNAMKGKSLTEVQAVIRSVVK